MEIRPSPEPKSITVSSGPTSASSSIRFTTCAGVGTYGTSSEYDCAVSDMASKAVPDITDSSSRCPRDEIAFRMVMMAPSGEVKEKWRRRTTSKRHALKPPQPKQLYRTTPCTTTQCAYFKASI